MKPTPGRNPDSLIRAILSRAPVGIAVIDYDGVYVSVNPAYAAIYGFAMEDMVGSSFLMVFPEDAHDAVLARHRAFLDVGGHLGGEWSVVRHDGIRLTVWSDSVPFPSDTGRPDRLVYVLDISAQKIAQEQQRIAATVYETTSEAILVTDTDNRIIAVNPAFTRLSGFSLADVEGSTPRIFKSDRHDDAFYAAIWESLTQTGLWSGEIWDRRKTGELYLKEMTITVVKDAAGRVQNYVSVFSDITERKSAEELIRRQANYDSVTGLPNRHRFHTRLEQGARAAEREGAKLALVLIDLDRFKEVNDTLGHTVGDLLLGEVSARLLRHVRAEDTIARIGGDEFALILTGLAHAEEAEARAREVLKCFETPASIGYEQIFMSASIGISIYPSDTRSLESLFKNADQALYVAKASGRNCLHFFTPELELAALDRMRLANDLRRALAEGQFVVHYQPIVDLRTGHISKAESLIRWRHPTRGLIGPDAFISLAEETGQILPLGDWVAREAIAEVVRCRREYDPRFQITVNQSTTQFRSPDFAGISWVVEMLAQGLDGRAIAIEITESLLLAVEPIVTKNLLAFRDAGIQIAIDDFGTGYSSLAYLRKFDIDTLKIDRSFVADLDGPGLDICEAIIIMAHRLGLDVVAEGVETERQCDILRAIGCDYAQGFLFAPALPADAFEAMLQEQRFGVGDAATGRRA
jgi:diguanylate cyclase (GGDEF)-like protein/PAS domain S-box-containing protein